MKSFMKNLDVENAHINEINELILTLTNKKYDQKIIHSLEKKREEILHEFQR